jgi:phosphoglycolate phosphatase-like HAD superfamily hydrolase
MHLVMFDIDGTLTASNRIDTECFLGALGDVLGIQGVDTDWSKYGNATDQGCLEEVVQHHRNRTPTPAETLAVKTRHFDLLRQKSAADPSTCQLIPGAWDVLVDLSSRKGVAVSLATGAWQESARIKLEAARIPYQDLPIASSDDDVSRTAIMRVAEERTKQKTGCPTFCSKTYIGDAVWDMLAAGQLHYEFIGIALGPNADRLRSAGTSCVIQDFLDNAFFKRLEQIWK